MAKETKGAKATSGSELATGRRPSARKVPPSIGEIKERALPVLSRYGAKRAGLFGSVVRGEAHAESDVDILVELDDSLNLFDFVGLKQDLEETIGRRVDLVEYGTLKPLIKDQVLQQEVPI